MFKNNLLKLRKKMKENNIDLAFITDDDSLYYFTGYYNFLHIFSISISYAMSLISFQLLHHQASKIVFSGSRKQLHK